MATHQPPNSDYTKVRENTIKENAPPMSQIYQQKGHPLGLKNFSQLARSINFSNGKEGEKKQANGGIRQKNGHRGAERGREGP